MALAEYGDRNLAWTAEILSSAGGGGIPVRHDAVLRLQLHMPFFEKGKNKVKAPLRSFFGNRSSAYIRNSCSSSKARCSSSRLQA